MNNISLYPACRVLFAAALILTACGCNRGGSSSPNATAAAHGEEHSHEGETHAEESHAGQSHGDHEHGEEDGHEHEAGEEHGGHDLEAEVIEFDPDTLPGAGIAVQAVQLAPGGAGFPVTGFIEPSPDKVVKVSSLVPGRLVRLDATIGQRVARGQVLAVVESKDVGQAQAAYGTAAARLQNAASNLQVVAAQARAGVYSRAPLEAARLRLVEARADVAAQENAVRGARLALETAQRLAGAGSYTSPALEGARRAEAEAVSQLQAATAARESAAAAETAAGAELARRRAVAAGGGYSQRAVQDAQKELSSAVATERVVQSELATGKAALARARALVEEGLVATRDVEAARNAVESATARAETARTGVLAAEQELRRQQALAGTNVQASAELAEAEKMVTAAQSEVRTRQAEMVRSREALKLARAALARESGLARAGVANRREVAGARNALFGAQNALARARATLQVTAGTYRREQSIFGQNLNNSAQLQAARAQLVGARSEMEAARSTLQLLKTAPGGSARVPIRAPLAGVITEREAAEGEVLHTEDALLTIADNSVVHADFFVPERDIARVRLGAPIVVRADAVPGRVYNGTIELIHTNLDPKTRTVETHAELNNPGGLLRFGMAIKGTLQSSAAATTALRLPAAAVQDMDGKKVVFIATARPHQFRTRVVQTGETAGGFTRIAGGLRAGERVVVKGAFMVKAQAMKAELGHSH